MAEVIADDDCSPLPELSDRDGDLDTTEPCGPPGFYRLTVEIMGDDIAVLSSAELEFSITD